MAGMISGTGGGGREQTQTDINKWTPEQQKLGQSFINDYLMGRVGQGMEGYGGILPGTGGPSDVQKRTFAAAEGWSPFGGADTMDERVSERLATRRNLMRPSWEKETALLKEKGASMGLSHSSDILKAQSDLGHTRVAEEEQFTQRLYDMYEQWNLELTPQALQTMTQVGETQRQITEQGHQARFDEWIRTQPEYSPVIDQILAMLGMQPVEVGEQETDYSYWELTGTVAGGSDEAIKKDLVELTPYSFRYKQEFISDGNRIHIGVLAQDLEKIYPELVLEKEINGMMVKHVDYATLSTMLLLALKAKN